MSHLPGSLEVRAHTFLVPGRLCLRHLFLDRIAPRRARALSITSRVETRPTRFSPHETSPNKTNPNKTNSVDHGFRSGCEGGRIRSPRLPCEEVRRRRPRTPIDLQTRRARLSMQRTLCLISLFPFFASEVRGDVAMAHLTGESCTHCHASAEGGTLTSPGRAFKNSPLFEQFSKEAPRVQRRRPRPDDNEISGEASILVGRHEELFLEGPETTYRAYGDLRVNVDKVVGYDGLSFHGHLVARLDDAGREVKEADQIRVVSAYLRWFEAETSRVFRLGRQYVTVGPRALALDGADVFVPLGDHFDTELYGGLAVDNGEGVVAGDYAGGGRLGWTPLDTWNLGVSGTYQVDDAEPAYGLAGFDTRLDIHRDITLFGHAHWDAIGEELQDLLARVAFDLAPHWDLRVDYARVIPGSAIAKTSIFSVFSDDLLEKVTFDVAWQTTYDTRVHGFLTGVSTSPTNRLEPWASASITIGATDAPASSVPTSPTQTSAEIPKASVSTLTSSRRGSFFVRISARGSSQPST